MERLSKRGLFTLWAGDNEGEGASRPRPPHPPTPHQVFLGMVCCCCCCCFGGGIYIYLFVEFLHFFPEVFSLLVVMFWFSKSLYDCKVSVFPKIYRPISAISVHLNIRRIYDFSAACAPRHALSHVKCWLP